MQVDIKSSRTLPRLHTHLAVIAAQVFRHQSGRLLEAPVEDAQHHDSAKPHRIDPHRHASGKRRPRDLYQFRDGITVGQPVYCGTRSLAHKPVGGNSDIFRTSHPRRPIPRFSIWEIDERLSIYYSMELVIRTRPTQFSRLRYRSKHLSDLVGHERDLTIHYR